MTRTSPHAPDDTAAAEPAQAGAPAGPRRNRVPVLLIAPVVLAALGSWGLVRDGAFGNDESATRWAARLPLHGLFHLLGNVDAVHGLYYLGMHAWMVFGDGPVALRLPSLMAAVATAAIVTALGRRLSGSAVTGVVAGLLYAASPFAMFYAQTARSYAIVSLLVAAATLVLVRALDAERSGAGGIVVARRWVAYGVLIALSGWLNEMALLVLAAHAITLIVTGYAWRARLRWLVAAVLGAVTVSPLYVISSREENAVSWIIRPQPHDIVVLLREYFGPYTAVIVVSVACALVALVPTGRTRAAVAAGTTAEAWRNRGPVGLVSVALPLLVAPPLLLVVESEVGTPLYADRYVLYSVLGAVLLIAHGATRLGRRLFGARARTTAWVPGIAAVLCVLLVQAPFQQHIRTPDARLRDFGPPAAFVGNYAHPGDGVLFFGSFFRMVELGYPDDFRDVADVGVARTPLASGTFRGIDASLGESAPRILACNRIWVVGRRPGGRQASVLFKRERNLLVVHYLRVAVRQYHGLTVSLWTRRPVPLRQVPPRLRDQPVHAPR